MTLKIEPLYALFFIEGVILLCAALVFSFLRWRKYKKLYHNAQSEMKEVRKSAAAQPVEEATNSASETKEGGEIQEASPPIQEPEGQEEPVSSTEPVPQVEEQQEQEVEATTPEQAITPEHAAVPIEDDTPPAGVRNLQKIVALQKSIIVDLMCYREMFEAAQKKLVAIKEGNNELQEKIKGFMETSENKEELGEVVHRIEENKNELTLCIDTFEKENAALSAKFSHWEEEIKKLWSDDTSGEMIDESRYDELIQEKETLASRLADLEGKLEEKVKLLDDLQKQYDGIEQEYITLYHKHQEATKQQ